MSTVNDIGIPEVGSGILQPKLQHKWRATFANLGGGVDSQPLSMQVISFTRPSYSFDEVELHRYNSRDWIAGKHNYEPITITLEDDISGTASKVVQDQSQKQQWLTGAEGSWLCSAGEGSLYKFVTYLDGMDGCEQVVEKWTLEGCWLQNLDFGTFDYGVSEAVTITLTMRFTNARLVLGGYDRGEGVATGGAGRIEG